MARLLCLPIHDLQAFVSGHEADLLRALKSYKKAGYRVEAKVIELCLKLGL